MNKILEIPFEIREYLSYCPKTGVITWIKVPNNKIKIGKIAGYLDKIGYLSIRFKGKLYRAHRLAWFLYYDKQPAKYLDHIDNNSSNNRISNLRECTQSQNSMNSKMSKNNKSGYIGISWRKNNKWCAYIGVNYKQINLGYFTKLEDAISARKDAEVKYFGEFQFQKAGKK